MRIPRQAFVILGTASLLAAVAIGGTLLAPGRADNTAFATGYNTPQPTYDPCLDVTSNGVGGDLVMAQQAPECTTPTEETPPKTHTPTPEPTDEPTEPPATEPAVTNTVAPATSTPSGGAGAGGLTPPNTGGNGQESAGSAGWLLIAGAIALAVGGTGALGYGLRKN